MSNHLPKSEEALDKVVKSLETWKKLTEAVYEDDNEILQQMNVIKNQVLAHVELEKLQQQTTYALEALDNKLDSDVKCEDLDALYQECWNDLQTSTTNNYQESRVWQAVFGGVSDVIEVRKKKKKLNDTEYEELGDSLLCSNVFAPPIDPISKVVISNAYKNRRCGHVYEYDTITDYIRRVKSKAKCPYIGCNNHQLRITDLVQDGDLQSQITQYLSTQSGEESDEY